MGGWWNTVHVDFVGRARSSSWTKVRNKPIYSRLARRVAAAGYPLRDGEANSNSEREWKLNWRNLKARARSDSQCSSNSGVKLRTAAAQRSRDKRFIPPTRNGPINTTSEKRVCIRVCIGVWLWVSKACLSPVSNSEKCDKHTLTES